MKQIKEKKISVKITTRNLKDGKALDCRVIYDKKSTKFKIVHIEMSGTTEDAFILKEKRYHSYYLNYVKGIVKYEIDLLGDKFQLNKIGDRIALHSISIFESLNKELQEIIIEKAGEVLFYNEMVKVVGHDPLISRHINDKFFSNFYTHLSLRNFINSLQANTSVEVYLLPINNEQRIGIISALQLIHFQQFLYERPNVIAQEIDFGNWCANIGNIQGVFGKFLADKLIGRVRTTEEKHFFEAEKNLKYTKEQIPLIIEFISNFANRNHPLRLIHSYFHYQR